jgi:hypothetical protein
MHAPLHIYSEAYLVAQKSKQPCISATYQRLFSPKSRHWLGGVLNTSRLELAVRDCSSTTGAASASDIKVFYYLKLTML